ncbi:MAG: c-type cytochrome [Vicinamibacterales bacterium]
MPRLALYVVAAACAGVLAGALGAQVPANVWAGVYTAEQAARGKAVFDGRDCITCHDEEGRAGDDGVPPIVGPYFMTRWDGQTVADITAFIAENMPRTKPRTLTPEEVADVTAYLFRLNELPAGATALPADAAAARGIRFTETAPAK